MLEEGDATTCSSTAIGERWRGTFLMKSMLRCERKARSRGSTTRTSWTSSHVEDSARAPQRPRLVHGRVVRRRAAAAAATARTAACHIFSFRMSAECAVAAEPALGFARAGARPRRGRQRRWSCRRREGRRAPGRRRMVNGGDSACTHRRVGRLARRAARRSSFAASRAQDGSTRSAALASIGFAFVPAHVGDEDLCERGQLEAASRSSGGTSFRYIDATASPSTPRRAAGGAADERRRRVRRHHVQEGCRAAVRQSSPTDVSAITPARTMPARAVCRPKIEHRRSWSTEIEWAAALGRSCRAGAVAAGARRSRRRATGELRARPRAQHERRGVLRQRGPSVRRPGRGRPERDATEDGAR